MKLSRIAVLLVVVSTLGIGFFFLRTPATEPIPGRNSSLWGRAGEAWLPEGRLPDFSFAGYGLGDRALPTPPVRANVLDFGAIADDDGDDSAAFQAALAAVDAGALWIPPGRYVLTQVLRLDRPGVVLRGAGAGRSTLYCPKGLGEILGDAPEARGSDGYWSWGGGMIWLAGEERGESVASVVAVAPRGSRRIELSQTTGLAPGQIVRLVQDGGDGSLWEHLHGGPAAPGPDLLAWAGGRLVDFASPIAAVEDGAVVLARPLRVDLRPEWNPRLFTHRPTVSEVGVEGLTLEFEPEPYGGHHREAGLNGIFLEGVHQFWIRDVEILDADNGIVSDGISRFGTIRELRLANDRRLGTITGHHGISLEGPQDILVTGFRIETRFIHDLTVDGLACGNVFSKGRGIDLSLDHHTGAPYENLFSDLDAGIGARLWENGGPPTGWGPYSAARETFWNLRVSGPAEPLPDYPQMNVIGLAGVETASTASQWVEALDPAEILPQDLHLAQLRRRHARRVD